MPMSHTYDWRFSEPGDRLTVHMINLEGGRPIFEATLALARTPISGARLAMVLLRYPFMTLQVIAAIYWQAFRLWRKGAPYHLHPIHTRARAPHGAVSEEHR
jgi:DUF1365 family protein